MLIYGENGHSGGVSDELRLVIPASNLEVRSFTQLSEFWLYQQIGHRFHLRLGKQDANRDFGNPRFPGNFVNSSFGVLPGVPMPSFPAPGLGASTFFDATSWLQLRGGIFEGGPQIGSFGGSAFRNGAGVFGIAGFMLLADQGSQKGQFGIWKNTNLNRNGMFALYDMLLSAGPHDNRSIQLFVRGAWSPRIGSLSTEDITTYIGGGLTAHGFFGANNTAGLGAGLVDSELGEEKFVEVFFKIRRIIWLTFEPDVQLYFTPDSRHIVFHLRTKIKL